MAEGRKLAIPILGLVLVLTVLLCLAVGSTALDPVLVFSPGSVDNIIFLSVRLPRVVAAATAGMAFALAGVLLQAASGNSLASPNIIGVNSGAGFAVLLCMCLLPRHFLLLPVAAFAGALLATGAVFLISSLTSRLSSASSLILSGVAVNAFFNALTSTLSSLRPDLMGSYSAFSIGGFAGIQTRTLVEPVILILASGALALSCGPLVDVISLGDELASSLGYRPSRLRVGMSALAAFLAACAVSYAGLLGFVGLVTPHLARFLTGGGGRRTLAASALAGAVLVLLSDLLARTLVSPGELPAGVFMAAIGVPFLIILLTRRPGHA